jgi:hypothetical protein
MNQIQKNQSNFNSLDALDEEIENAKLELQKAMSLLVLETSVEEAFAGVLDSMSKIEEIASRIENNDIRFLASEKIALYSKHFDEVIKQANIKLH